MKIRFTMPLLLLIPLLFLTGCQANEAKDALADNPPVKPADTAKTQELSGLSDNVTIQGVVTYFENRMLIGDQTLVVTLEDISQADAPAKAIARYHKRIQGQLPLYFAITYDPKQLKPGHRYNLQAKIIDTQSGTVDWQSTQAYPYVPDITRDINIRVRPVGYQNRKAAQYQTYLCGDKQEPLHILVIGDKIKLSFRGNKWILPKTVSASGSKFENARVMFWSHGQEAVYQEAGQGAIACRLSR